MSRGQRVHRATLSDIPSDATPVTYSPATIWVAAVMSAPGPSDESAKSYAVETSYNAQLTTATKLTLDDGRVLFTRGVQHEGDVTRLYCEEVLQP